MSNDGGPAFPNGIYQEGMSLRDWFAGQALVGILAEPTDAEGYAVAKEAVPDVCAADAYAIADAMIAAREGKVK